MIKPDPTRHPLQWFYDRIGGTVRRIYGGHSADHECPIKVHSKSHAEYLFIMQTEVGYRYVDFMPAEVV